VHIQVKYPSPALAEYVKCYWILESDKVGHRELVYPTGESQMMFHFRKPFWSTKPDGTTSLQPRLFISGLNTSYRIIEVKESCGVIGVCFYPYSLKMLLPFSLKELTDIDLPFEDAFPGFRELEYQIEERRNNYERIALIEAILIRSLRRPITHYSAIRNVVNAIEQTKNVKRENIISKYPFSEKQLERLFNSHIGVSPHRFIELLRFRRAVKMINSPLDLTSIAIDCGYYDQSHFIKSFKRYTGLTPGEFRVKYGDAEIG